MAKELDDFLDPEGEAPAAGASAASAVEPEPSGEAAREPVEGAKPGDAAAAKPGDAAKPEDVVEPEDVTGLKSALQATRRERADHKGRAERLEGEMAALRAQLEAQKPAAPAPPERPQEIPVPSPLEDPQGYHVYTQRMMFNERLNMSEAMLRSQHDDADVDAKMAVFKAAADQNPALRSELTRQPNPYRWAYQQAQRLMAMEEIGSDPAAFRARVEAETRAKLEAEFAAGTPPPPAGRVLLPQSLGTARSAGARNTPVINVAEDFDDILAPAPRRKA
jgi:hypothetical protein